MKPNFDNCHFYLGRIPSGLPQELSGNLDGILASELFLHLTEKEVVDSMEMARQNLKPGGNFMVTAYTQGMPYSLDCEFVKLGEKVGMDRKDLIERGVVNISKLAEKLKKEGLYEKNRRKYWLDLEQIRTFSDIHIKRQAENFGLRIISNRDIQGGMFPFAWRSIYVLRK